MANTRSSPWVARGPPHLGAAPRATPPPPPRTGQHIRPNDRVIAMCIRADAPDSVRFSEITGRWAAEGRRCVFVSGGSNGLSDAVLARADERVSFSNLTFPHGLMRVILLEQLYRAERIRAGEKYHK